MRLIDREILYEEVAEMLGIEIDDVEQTIVSQFGFVADKIASGDYNKGVRLRGFGVFSPSTYRFVKIMISRKNIKALLKKWKQAAIDNPDRKVGIKAMDLVRILQTCEKLYKDKDSNSTKR